MKHTFTAKLAGLLLCFLVVTTAVPANYLSALAASTKAYPSAPLDPDAPVVRRVNAPYSADRVRIADSAVFWFGRVTTSENYADVRVGYTSSQLVIRLNIIDRLLWHSNSPTAATLTAHDAVSLYLSRDGNAGNTPDANDYLLVAMLNSSASNPAAQAAYRGDGAGWQATPVVFTATSGWRGDAKNNTVEDRGWSQEYIIPFTSLGLSAAPASHSVWGLAVALHDRDDTAGTPIAVKTWPEGLDAGRPSTWGQLAFGLPAFQPPAVTPIGTTIIRQGLNGAQVADAAVGGTIDNLCPSNSNYIWNGWGNANFGEAPRFNLQNQGDVADWPCFAKYFVTFPLGQIPAGKTIISARLTMRQWGGSDPTRAERSLIQVMSVAEDWNESNLSWNNAPLAMENVSRSWADVVNGCSWPCAAREWDVGLAATQAYESGAGVLRLALYEADAAYHSGKYFIASEEPEWNAVGRPTLTIVWGNRPAQLSMSISPLAPQTDQSVLIQLQFNGTGETLNLVNTLPNGLGAPTGLNANAGTIQYDPGLHRVTWSGAPPAGGAITLNIATPVTTQATVALIAGAILTGPSGEPVEVQSTIAANGDAVYLPFTIR